MPCCFLLSSISEFGFSGYAWRLGNNFGGQAHLSRVEKLLDAVAWSGELEGHRSGGKMYFGQAEIVY